MIKSEINDEDVHYNSVKQFLGFQKSVMGKYDDIPVVNEPEEYKEELKSLIN